MTDIRHRASFDIIRYANCWEDADILVESLAIEPGSNCLSVASGGDNSFALLACDPALVVAADISAVQIALVDLKRVAIGELDHQSFLEFAGFREYDDGARSEIYQQVRRCLMEDSQRYWDEHHELIGRGIIHAGKFERYFASFRRRILPLIHSRDDIMSLLARKSQSERIGFYRKRWDTWRWRLLFRIFFSRYVMGKMGRDPEFFRHVEGSVADRILRRVEYALTMLPGEDNPYMTYILTGGFGNALPFYVREENYTKIRERIDRLRLYRGAIEGTSAEFDVRFDACNLSDIFEYMDPEQFHQVALALVDGCNRGARLSYWNMLAPRRISEILPDKTEFLEELSEKLFRRDRAFFYQAFLVDRVK
jgi:S-adenosylmethionine-diacylglycerol 3-amino-3-carboxypropyl transferase